VQEMIISLNEDALPLFTVSVSVFLVEVPVSSLFIITFWVSGKMKSNPQPTEDSGSQFYSLLAAIIKNTFSALIILTTRQEFTFCWKSTAPDYLAQHCSCSSTTDDLAQQCVNNCGDQGGGDSTSYNEESGEYECYAWSNATCACQFWIITNIPVLSILFAASLVHLIFYLKFPKLRIPSRQYQEILEKPFCQFTFWEMFNPKFGVFSGLQLGAIVASLAGVLNFPVFCECTTSGEQLSAIGSFIQVTVLEFATLNCYAAYFEYSKCHYWPAMKKLFSPRLFMKGFFFVIFQGLFFWFSLATVVPFFLAPDPFDNYTQVRVDEDNKLSSVDGKSKLKKEIEL
jgi:hypothetical protein